MKSLRTKTLAILTGIITGLTAFAQESVFQADFSGNAPFEGWNGTKPELSNDAPDGTACIKFHIPAPAEGQSTKEMKLIQHKLDLELIRGKTLTVGAQVKGENIVKQPQAWLCPKIQIVYKQNSKLAYYDMPIASGTYDWTVAVFTVKIPADIEDAFIVLGIQGTSGSFWISNLRIKAAAQ